jgi:hypothetical protein
MPYAVPVISFSQIQDEFIGRVHEVVWCNVTTVDTRDRPRSRILHPIWEGKTGWVATLRHAHVKARHIAHNPYVSLTYVAEAPGQVPLRPVYVDCLAEWDDTSSAKRHVWELFLAAPPPLGYDPAPIFGFAGIERPDHPEFGVLRLDPWRVELVDGPGESRVWRV